MTPEQLVAVDVPLPSAAPGSFPMCFAHKAPGRGEPPSDKAGPSTLNSAAFGTAVPPAQQSSWSVGHQGGTFPAVLQSFLFSG